MKLQNFLILAILSFGFFLITNLFSARLPYSMPEQAAAGKLVWQRYNCVSCHTLFGNGGYVGDDLTHIAAKRDSSQLVEYLVKPPVMRPNLYKRHPALNAEEAKDLVQYLEFIHTIPTLGWPPKPTKRDGAL